jgi:hypothetical protein
LAWLPLMLLAGVAARLFALWMTTVPPLALKMPPPAP